MYNVHVYYTCLHMCVYIHMYHEGQSKINFTCICMTTGTTIASDVDYRRWKHLAANVLFLASVVLIRSSPSQLKSYNELLINRKPITP